MTTIASIIGGMSNDAANYRQAFSRAQSAQQEAQRDRDQRAESRESIPLTGYRHVYGLTDGCEYCGATKEMVEDNLRAPFCDIRPVPMPLTPPYPNLSGWRPLEHKCLLKPEAVEKVTKGGIILADTTTESEKFKTVRGTIVAVSPFAFSYVDDEEWARSGSAKPKPGDTVLYAKFAGMWIKGDDGEEYLLVNDQDLVAVR